MQQLDRHRREQRRRALGSSLSGTNLERAADHNQRVTLQAIRINGPITRADLADLTGLTTQAIANITNRLLAQGFILEVGRVHGRRGQPAKKLAINPNGCFSIGVNIDRDHITFVAIDLTGQVRARETEEIDFAMPDSVSAFFRRAIDSLLGSRKVSRDRLVGVGVALPDDLGRIDLPRRPSSYTVWNTVDVSRLFSNIVPLPVFVENDAAAAAIGELQFGHGMRSPSFFYLLISAALGGGLVIEGSYFRGADGRSGEIGFLPVRSRKTPARTLQEVVSLSALYEQLAAAGYEISRPDQLNELDQGGLAQVEKWIETSAEFLTDPLIAVSCLVNPKAVLIGGRLPANWVDRLADKLNQRLRRRAGDVPVIAPVLRAAMAADAPAIGAAILPLSDRLLPSRAGLMNSVRD